MYIPSGWLSSREVSVLDRAERDRQTDTRPMHYAFDTLTDTLMSTTVRVSARTSSKLFTTAAESSN